MPFQDFFSGTNFFIVDFFIRMGFDFFFQILIFGTHKSFLIYFFRNILFSITGHSRNEEHFENLNLCWVEGVGRICQNAFFLSCHLKLSHSDLKK